MINNNGDRRRVGIDYENLEKPSNEFLCWFAGFLEADGHVGKHGNKKSMHVTQAKEKGRRQCLDISEKFGGIGRMHVRPNEEVDEHSICYRWETSDPNAIAQILEWIQPYLDVNTKLNGMLDHFDIEETVPIWEQKQYYTEDAMRDSLQTCSQHAVNLKHYIKELNSIKNDPKLADVEEPNLIDYTLSQSDIDLDLDELVKAVSSSTQFAIKRLKDQDLWSEKMGLYQEEMVITDVVYNRDKAIVYAMSKKGLSDAVTGFGNIWLEENGYDQIELKSTTSL